MDVAEQGIRYVFHRQKKHVQSTEVYLEPWQTSKMELFPKAISYFLEKLHHRSSAVYTSLRHQNNVSCVVLF